MTELFEDSDDKILVDDDLSEVDEIVDDHRIKLSGSDARRRLEDLMEEKRLQNELSDYFDE